MMINVVGFVGYCYEIPKLKLVKILFSQFKWGFFLDGGEGNCKIKEIFYYLSPTSGIKIHFFCDIIFSVLGVIIFSVLGWTALLVRKPVQFIPALNLMDGPLYECGSFGWRV